MRTHGGGWMFSLAQVLLIAATCLSIAPVGPALAGPPPRGERWLAAGEPVTECSTLHSQRNAEIGGLLSTFYEDGVYRYAVTHVNLQQFPAGFFADPAAYLIFRVWKESGGSPRLVRELPARLFLYDKQAGVVLRNAPIDRISQNTLGAVMALSRRALPGNDYKHLFDDFSILLSEIDETWEGVTITGYADGADHEPTFAADALLPPFAAEPKVYARLGASPALQSLHPFAAVEQTDAAGLCARFDRDVKQARSDYTAVDRPYLRGISE